MVFNARVVGSGSSAIRGHVVTVTGDPFLTSDALREFTDGLVIVEGGRIRAVGPFSELRRQLAPGTIVDHYPDGIITSGFVDTHVHYVQTGMIASYGAQLIDWLNTYTFVEEQRFDDKAYADAVAKVFFDQLLSNGTTTALTFCAVYPSSVDAFFEEATRRNMRMAGGKVLMNRNAPEALLDTVQTGFDDSKALIEKWHGKGRNHYAVTPRFAATSTGEQLESAATLLNEHPGTLLQTHLCENLEEIAWVRSLFPDASDYLDVYDRAGLLRPGAVLAHGVHLTAGRVAPRARDRIGDLALPDVQSLSRERALPGGPSEGPRAAGEDGTRHGYRGRHQLLLAGDHERGLQGRAPDPLPAGCDQDAVSRDPRRSRSARARRRHRIHRGREGG